MDRQTQVSIQVVSATSAFRSLEGAWEELTSHSLASIFQTFDWQFLWWKHYGMKPDLHLHILLFSIDCRLVGIVPLFIQSHLFHGLVVHRQLKLLGSGLESPSSPVLSLERLGPGDHLDIIVEPGYETIVAAAFAGYLRENEYLWDQLALQNIPEQSINVKHVLAELAAQGYAIHQTVSDLCPQVTLPSSLDEFLTSLKPKVRRNIRHTLQEFLQNPEFQVRHVAGTAELSRAYDALVHLHQRRWNALGYPGLFSDKRFGAFHLELAHAFQRKGRLWFSMLEYRGSPVVAQMGFLFRQTMVNYMSGFERKPNAKYSGAGMTIVMMMVRHAIEAGCQVVDMGRGSEGYKFQLTSTVERNLIIRIKSSTYASTPFRASTASWMTRWNKARLRVSCEVAIARTIASLRGTHAVLYAFPGHVATRLKHRWVSQSKPGMRTTSFGKSMMGAHGRDVETAAIAREDMQEHGSIDRQLPITGGSETGLG